jgi:hypothetical protein
MPNDAIAHHPKVAVFTDSQTTAVPALLAELEQPLPHAELVQINSGELAQLLSPSGDAPANWLGTVDWLRQQRFAAALILTAPGQSPYTLGYLCYLAGIPIRVGRSQEFGGQVLTHCLAVEEEEGVRSDGC